MKVKIYSLQFRFAGCNMINNISFQEITNNIIFWNPVVCYITAGMFSTFYFLCVYLSEDILSCYLLQEIKLRHLKCSFENSGMPERNLKPWTQKFHSVLAFDFYLKQLSPCYIIVHVASIKAGKHLYLFFFNEIRFFREM